MLLYLKHNHACKPEVELSWPRFVLEFSTLQVNNDGRTHKWEWMAEVLRQYPFQTPTCTCRDWALVVWRGQQLKECRKRNRNQVGNLHFLHPKYCLAMQYVSQWINVKEQLERTVCSQKHYNIWCIGCQYNGQCLDDQKSTQNSDSDFKLHRILHCLRAEHTSDESWQNS